MAKIAFPKGSGKRLKVSEKSGNFEMDRVATLHERLLLKERICSQRKQILSFNRSPQFEKGVN